MRLPNRTVLRCFLRHRTAPPRCFPRHRTAPVRSVNPTAKTGQGAAGKQRAQGAGRTVALASSAARARVGRDRKPNSGGSARTKATPERRCCWRKLLTGHRRRTNYWWTGAIIFFKDSFCHGLNHHSHHNSHSHQAPRILRNHQMNNTPQIQVRYLLVSFLFFR